MDFITWHDADPFAVGLDESGTVELRLQDQVLATVTLELVHDPAAAGPMRLLKLAGNATAPSPARWSWVNDRGRGQIVVVQPGQVLACQLRGRLPRSAQVLAAVGEPQRHPMAGYWLSVAMTVHEPRTLAALVALSGYSYPTVHEWVKREGLAGRVTTMHGHGRAQILQVNQGALPAWWSAIKGWWPELRSASWPKRHGPGEVHWGRAEGRLPSLVIGKHQVDRRWSGRPDDDGWLWATGADHLAGTGALIQNHDSDVWVARAAWQVMQGGIKPVDPPKGPDAWPATRFTILDDDHALLRLAWFRAGSMHPHDSEVTRKLLEQLERRPGFLDALPLLDAIHHSDARVAEQGRERLGHFERKHALR